VVDHLGVRLKRRLRGLFGIGLEIVDARDAVEHLKLEVRVGLQKLADLDDRIRFNLNPRIDGIERRTDDLVAKLLLQAIEHTGTGHES
jgi:hypothetical protein